MISSLFKKCCSEVQSLMLLSYCHSDGNTWLNWACLNWEKIIFFFHFLVVCCGHNFHAHFSLLNQLQVSLSQNLCSWVSQLEQGKEILTCLFEGRLWIYGVNNSINFNKLWFKLSFVTAGSKSLFFLSRLF